MDKRKQYDLNSPNNTTSTLGQINKTQLLDNMNNVKLTKIKINYIPSDNLVIDFDIYAYFHQTMLFSVYEIRRHGTNEKYTALELKIKTIEDFNMLEKAINNADKLVHHHLLTLQFYSHEMIIKENQKFWKFWILYEYYSIDLPTLVMQRLNTDLKNFFSEQYIMQFCRDMVSLFAFLKLFNFDHRPLNPYNFVISHGFAIKFNGINIGKYNLIHKERDRTETPRDYLAPEELEAQLKDKSKKEKAEVYTFGLILVFMASLNSIEGLNTDPEKLRARIKSLEQYYTSSFTKILELMLESSPNRRLTFAELYTKINKKYDSDAKHVRIDQISTTDQLINNPTLSLNTESITKTMNPMYSNTTRSKSSNQMEISNLLNNTLQEHNYDVDSDNKPLYISNIYSSYITTTRMFHTFIPLTKTLIRVPIIDLKSIYFDMITLKMNFLIPAGHRSCYTQDGKLFLFGAINITQNSYSLTNTYLYNSHDNTLIQKSSMKYQRFNFSLCSIDNNFIFVVGGHDNLMSISNTCEIYDIKNDIWTIKSSMKTPCFNSLLCTFNKEYIYRIGGMIINSQLSDNIERYSIALDRWSIVPLRRNPFMKFRILALSSGIQINQNQLLVFGGYDEARKPKSVSYILNIKSSYNLDTMDDLKEKEEIIKINEHKTKNIKLDNYFYPDQVLIDQKHVIALEDSNDSWKIVAANEQNQWIQLESFSKDIVKYQSNSISKRLHTK